VGRRGRVGVAVAFGLVALALMALPGPEAAWAVGLPPGHTPTALATDGPPAASLAGWTNLTPGLPGAPGPRYAGAAAWDNVSGQAVLFGGLGVSSGPLRSTWTFSNGGWHSAGPASPNASNDPSSRFGAGMAFDPVFGESVLFGGRDAQGGLLADTWSFDGTNWTNLTAGLTGAPAARVNESLEYDPAIGKIVLFGGRSPSSVFSDTWEFNGTAWKSAGAATPNSTNTPAQRYNAPLVYSATRGELVLFGGTVYRNGTYAPANDTWGFGPGGWHLLHPSRAPSPRSSPSATVLPDGEEILFGGVGTAAALADTWLYNGTTWTNVTATLGIPPSARSDAFAVPAAAGNGTSYVLVFGGFNGRVSLSDTWAVGADGIVATRGAAFPPALDVGQKTTLTVVAFGPGGGLSFSWVGLPAGCASSSTPSLSCTPTQQGRYAAAVTVTNGASSSNLTVTIALLVNTPPVINAVIVSPFPLVIGTGNVTLSVQATGGTGNLHYSYSGLPPGCVTNDTPFLTCGPALSGSWTVQATVLDATNGTASKSATVVVTATGPSKPSHLVTVLESPLGITALLVAVGIALMVVYAVVRRRRARRPPTAARKPTPTTRPASPPPTPASRGPPPKGSPTRAPVNRSVPAATRSSGAPTAPGER